MRKILVAVDGSDHASRALELSCDLAKAHGSQVLVIHATNTQPLSADERRLAEVEYEQQLTQAAREKNPGHKSGVSSVSQPDMSMQHHVEMDQRIRSIIGEKLLEHALARLRSCGVDNAECILRTGDPADMILEVAKSHGADTIVIGNRGRGSVAATFLGSVSSKVNHLSDVNVITVK